jgi:hypothetical protein
MTNIAVTEKGKMMERKFTDAEIVEALEICSQNIVIHHNRLTYKGIPLRFLFADVLDLIKRQKAEIERLNHIRAELSKENDALKEEKDNLIKTYKECMTEAIKEFADRLKESCFGNPYLDDDVLNKLTDNLVKEMTGENNGN